MANGPTTTNASATLINKIIAALANTGVQAVEALIIVDVPFLGLPGIKQIWEYLFGWVASYFIKAAQNGATFLVIDLQVGSEEASLSVALKNLIVAEKTGDPNAIKIAIQAYADAQSALIHDNGSAPPTG